MVAEESIEKYIESNPSGPSPADARVAGYGVPVWALISYLEAVHGDLERVAADYELPREAVEAAQAYYHRHKEVIDARRSLGAA